MFFKEFDPQKNKPFQVMDDDGNITSPKWRPSITDEFILECYKFMLFARTADLMAVSFQRQGRMYTYPPNLGQEAIATAIGQQMNPRDWLVPAFREMGAYLLKGARLRDIFLYWGGFEDGSKFSGAPNFMPLSIPIGSQFLHAVGLGYAANYQKLDSIIFTVTGDGGTSEGDFHEALNFGAVWKVPVVFIVQNNQYAISVPVRKQTASANLAVKAIAYAIPGIQVDGNDLLAVYKTVEEAIKHIKAGKGPVLIEALTYRRGAHTTSDDPTLYRTSEEEKQWEEKDPLKRLRGFLMNKGLWREEDDESLLEQFREEVEKEFAVYENYPPYPVEDVFKFQFDHIPGDLKQQQVAYEKFLQWQEGQK